MNIKKLRKEAVRNVQSVEDFVHLSNDELRQVVGGDGVEGPDVDPDTCAIHFYYPADVLA